MSLARIALCAVFVTLFAGCSAAPANVAGSYSVSLTDTTNDCMFSNWTGTTTGVPLDITQSGTAITATVGGAGGLAFDTIFGAHVMTGNVSGGHLDLVIHGARMDACNETLDAHASVDLIGDTLVNGTITYSYAHQSPTCPAYTATCSSAQAFNGTRPPSH